MLETRLQAENTAFAQFQGGNDVFGEAVLTQVTDITGYKMSVLTKSNSSALRPPLAAWVFRALLICCCAGLLSVILGPDNSWDLRFYHLYAPWAYLQGRYLYDIGPAHSQGFLNPTSGVLFYALISSKLNDFPRILAFVMGAVHGLNAVLIFAIVRHVLRPLQRLDGFVLRAAAFLVGVSGTGFVSLLGMTSNDLINSVFVLASLLCVLKVAELPAADRGGTGFALAGLFAGIAVGLKYTAAVFVPGLGTITIIAAIRRKTVGGPIAFAAASAVGVLAVAGHHLVTLWQDFGNPLFPFLNQIFHSPYYEPEPLRDKQFLPRDVWQALVYPFYWAKTNSYLVSEVRFRDWRGAIAYVAIAAGLFKLVTSCARGKLSRDDAFAETQGLALVFVFMIVSFFVWEFAFSIYRYAVVLEMLTGAAAMGGLIWLVKDHRLRIAAAIAVLAAVALTTIYPDWERGRFGNRYVDVRVPPLPPNSLVLLATGQPAAYFIPFAEPTARYLGIENNYLLLSQHNILASEVKRLMRTPGPSKFILSFGPFDSGKLNAILAHFGLRLGSSPCQPIRSNLEVDALSLCEAVEDGGRPGADGQD